MDNQTQRVFSEISRIIASLVNFSDILNKLADIPEIKVTLKSLEPFFKEQAGRIEELLKKLPSIDPTLKSLLDNLIAVTKDSSSLIDARIVASLAEVARNYLTLIELTKISHEKEERKINLLSSLRELVSISANTLTTLNNLFSFYSGLVGIRKEAGYLPALGITQEEAIKFVEPFKGIWYASLDEFARWQRELAFNLPKILQLPEASMMVTIYREAFASFGFEGQKSNEILKQIIGGLSNINDFSIDFYRSLEQIRKEFHIGREIANQFNISQTILLQKLLESEIGFKRITDSTKETVNILGMLISSLSNVNMSGTMVLELFDKMTRGLAGMSTETLGGLFMVQTGRLPTMGELIQQSPFSLYFETMRSFYNTLPSSMREWFILSFTQTELGQRLTPKEVLVLQEALEKGVKSTDFHSKLKEIENRLAEDAKRGEHLLNQLIDPLKGIHNLLQTKIVPQFDYLIYLMEDMAIGLTTYSALRSLFSVTTPSKVILGGAAVIGSGLIALNALERVAQRGGGTD